MRSILDVRFLNNTLQQWLMALGLMLVFFLVVYLLRRLALKKLEPLTQKTKTALDDAFLEMVRRTNLLAGLILAVYVGSRWLKLEAGPRETLKLITMVVVFLQVGRWGTSLTNFLIFRLGSATDGQAKTSAVGLLAFVGRLLVWSLVLFLVLDNLGVNITTLVTGLGIGGVAVALAVQKVLGDLFSSVAILVDKPFQEGDFIVVGDVMGTVEKIGLKTSRLRALSGEQIILANQDLTESRIRNFKRMSERRVVFSFGVVYWTPIERLSRIPEALRTVIESIPETRFERANFFRFGDSSLDFEVVYYVLDRDYNKYMNIQQKINLEIMRLFKKDNIEFAYPTRAVHIYNTGKASPHVGACFSLQDAAS